jgi:hypothetical protein
MVLITVLFLWLCIIVLLLLVCCSLFCFVLRVCCLLLACVVCVVLSCLPPFVVVAIVVDQSVLRLLIMHVSSRLVSFSFTTFDGLHLMDLLIHERLYHYVVSVATFLLSSYLAVVDYRY